MSILNRVKKTEKAKAEKSVQEEKSAPRTVKRNKLSKDKIGLVIAEPVITEKTSGMAPLNKYVFKVKDNATKNEVKKAVEGFYQVNVIDVNILKTASKPRRVGRMIGTKPGFKKAIVTVKEGESIELIKS